MTDVPKYIDPKSIPEETRARWSAVLREIREEREFLRILREDIDLCSMVLSVLEEQGHAQFGRRRLIHAFLTYVEGSAHRMRVRALGRAKRHPEKFSRGEIDHLHQIEWQMKASGKVREKTRFDQGAVLLKFTIKMHLHGDDDIHAPPHRFGEAGWTDLKTAIEIRNRIVHPKLVSDLNVSDDDLDTVRRGIAWFDEELERHRKALDDAACRENDRVTREAYEEYWDEEDAKAEAERKARAGEGSP